MGTTVLNSSQSRVLCMFFACWPVLPHLLLFWDRDALCSSGYPKIHYVAQAGPLPHFLRQSLSPNLELTSLNGLPVQHTLGS